MIYPPCGKGAAPWGMGMRGRPGLKPLLQRENSASLTALMLKFRNNAHFHVISSSKCQSKNARSWLTMLNFWYPKQISCDSAQGQHQRASESPHYLMEKAEANHHLSPPKNMSNLSQSNALYSNFVGSIFCICTCMGSAVQQIVLHLLNHCSKIIGGGMEVNCRIAVGGAPTVTKDVSVYLLEMPSFHGTIITITINQTVASSSTNAVYGGNEKSAAPATSNTHHDYRDALSKCILFFEGQRSGKLPANQRIKWRRDSALKDGSALYVDLVGGYYDAGDNVKFGFPMAFTATMLSWSVIEFEKFMSDELQNARNAIRWATDYLLKVTAQPDTIFVQVGNPTADHNCWERPEDMDTPRTVYKITKDNPGSDVAAETAAALAAASIVFRTSDMPYAQLLLKTAVRVFQFADKYRGAYSDSLRTGVCPFYCDFDGYQDELLWGAAWLHKATKDNTYLDYIQTNGKTLGADENINEFGWDNKHAGINVLVSKEFLLGKVSSLQTYKGYADDFICSLLPETSYQHVSYTPGGLIYKPGGSNMQHVTAISFLLLAYANYLSQSSQAVPCGNIEATPERLRAAAKCQVDYILGNNPRKLSYMVGYGSSYPKYIHHRGSSLPSVVHHPEFISCKGGSHYFYSNTPNPNLLVGAVVGGPDTQDQYPDSRPNFRQSEPTTYINAPLVGALAFFRGHPS
eukprot:Gb_29204 [translate_table: standard]